MIVCSIRPVLFGLVAGLLLLSASRPVSAGQAVPLPPGIEGIVGLVPPPPEGMDGVGVPSGALPVEGLGGQSSGDLTQLDAEMQRLQDEIDQIEAAQESGEVVFDGPEGWPDILSGPGVDPVRDVFQPPAGPVTVRLQPLTVTVLQFPPDERIVDCVIGDAVFFEVQCGDNLAYLKGLRSERRTIFLVATLSDRIYRFDLFTHNDLAPDQVLRVYFGDPVQDDSQPAAPAAAGPAAPGFPPRPRVGEREEAFPVAFAFEPAAGLERLRAEIDSAERELAELAERSAEEIMRMDILRGERLSDYLETYPARIEPRFRLSPRIQAPPLFVSQIWTDGRFTYLRSHAEESPALYEITGVDADEELLVNYTLAPDGLFVVSHVLDAGYAQLHGSRGEWHVWDVPPLSVVNAAGDTLPGLAPEWRRTRSQRSWFVRHNRLTAFMVVAAGAYMTLGVVNRGASAFCAKVIC